MYKPCSHQNGFGWMSSHPVDIVIFLLQLKYIELWSQVSKAKACCQSFFKRKEARIKIKKRKKKN